MSENGSNAANGALHQLHSRVRDEAAAEIAEMPAFIGAGAEGIWFCLGHDRHWGRVRTA